MRLVAFLVFMIILLTAPGFGVGTVELMIWLATVVVGVLVIFRRHRSRRRECAEGDVSRR